MPGWNALALDDAVRDWVTGTAPNHGIRLATGGTAGQSVKFHSAYNANPPQLEVRYVPATRHGVLGPATLTDHDFGGGNIGHVNASTGSLVLEHAGGAVALRGFSVDLTHTYNAQDAYGQTARLDSAGAHYGEGWTFAPVPRLFEMDGGAAVLFKHASGESWIYARDAVELQRQTCLRPHDPVYALTRDLRPTADAGYDAGYYTNPPAAETPAPDGEMGTMAISRYNGRATADYARRYVFDYNPYFRVYDRCNDCTNYASQSLRAGGGRTSASHAASFAPTVGTTSSRTGRPITVATGTRPTG